MAASTQNVALSALLFLYRQVLHVTERTVKFHVGSILAKLGAGNRTEAARIAVRRGLIQLTD